MAYIDVRVEFDTEEEDFGDGEVLTMYSPRSVRMVGSDIPADDRSGVAESAFQSDVYTVGVSNAMLSALGSDDVQDVEPY